MASIRLDPEPGAALRRLLADTCIPPDADVPRTWPLDPGRPDLWRLSPRGRRWSGVRPVDGAPKDRA